MNTMETYRKINQWTSHSRDMVESFKRYYNNSFLDAQRQEAYNLFLGNYVFAQGEPLLWDLSTDYYLHHADPRAWSTLQRRSYINWFTPTHLVRQEMPERCQNKTSTTDRTLRFYDDYWLEYYRPLAISSFQKIFSYKMNSTLKYIPVKSTQDGRYDLSPFRIRDGIEQDTVEKPLSRKGVTIADTQTQEGESSFREVGLAAAINNALPKRTRPYNEPLLTQHSILKDTHLKPTKPSTGIRKDGKLPKDKSAIAQWTLNQFVVNSLNPSVSGGEMNEYGRYISHPLNLPLVVSTEAPPDPNLEFRTYVDSVSSDAVMNLHSTEEDIADYEEFLDVGEAPLTVTEADTPKKRYKAYRQWLKGKSLFKQQRTDP